MKNKIYFVIGITLLIVALLIPFVVAAMPENIEAEEKQFFSVDNTNKKAGSNLEMSINLDAINYDNFIFTLENIDKTSNIETSEIENVEIEEGNNSFKITGNKANINIDIIKLSYKIPENLEIGATLTFLATIEENIESEDVGEIYENDEQEEIDITVNKEEKVNNKQDLDSEKKIKEKQTIEVTITIVESDEDNNRNEEDNKNIDNEDENNSNNQEQNNNQNIDKTQQNQDNLQEQNKQGQDTQNLSQISSEANTASNMTLSSNTKSTSNTTQSETVTYNGSSNNYLKSLSIKGYEFTKEFSKESTTYFVKVEEDISTLTVNATAEDNNATICIYGNENIQEGSKILISVTAENGNVRTYRIYIT